MSFNTSVAQVFERMAAMLELTGADKFRVNAHARAARSVGDHAGDLEPIAGDEKALTAIEGIGKGTAAKIAEFARTGTVAEHDELLAKVPPGLLEVLRVPGLGPKTVKLMWEQLKIESVDDLKATIADGSLAGLPRMGAKTIDNIADALAFMADSGKRLHAGVARPIAEMIRARLAEVPGVTRVAYAGSLRRGRETVGDLDFLVTADDPGAAMEAFRGMAGVEKVLAAGETKSSVRLALPELGGKRFSADDSASVQVDLRVVPAESWGAALMYFTGSKDHNVRLRERALKRGMTLNEYGLFEDDGGEGSPQSRGVVPVASATEEDVYGALDLAWVPPTMREDRGELDAADGGTLPELVTLDDIRAELHSHTTASDGVMEILESARIAKGRGFHTLAVTDHSKSSAIANGLSPERLRAHIGAIREADEEIKGISILAGSEVDILADGALDYDDELLGDLDVVVASPHAALSQDAKKATTRLLRAIEHPLVHIIGHPTGRLIERRRGLEPAMDEIIAAAVEHNVALEINAHWMRLDLRDTHVRAAAESGCLIAIDCDVHAPGDYDNLVFGVETGQRGWLTKELCVNAWSKARLHGWLKKGRG
ncbi:MAG: DNA polymerase/3'-5' exonuclease PolX [Phycisphaeraceae bacterium]|nr:MAG: DNA polymerase/3'-5' exonuclease PolX [Phycisphaeraceae bacterium]